MCSLPRDVRFTFKGIWEVCADDFGRFLPDPRVVKGAVWPVDDDVSLKKVEAYMQILADRGRILLYEINGVRYGAIVNWLKHQRVSHPTPSRFPEPPTEVFRSDSENPREQFPSDSVLSGADRRGEERNRSGAEENPPAAPPPAPLLAALAFPQGVIDFLAMFYEPAFTEKQRERYRDIVSQLWDAVDPKHAGPKIRGGIRVKARNMEHLDFCCRATMRDPPNDRDRAIVFVLKRLTDPPPGPTPAEKHKVDESARVAEEDQYQREARSAGVRWAKEHAAEYEPILTEVDRQFVNAPASSFSKMAKESLLTQKCAIAAGFPDFDTWRNARRGAA